MKCFCCPVCSHTQASSGVCLLCGFHLVYETSILLHKIAVTEDGFYIQNGIGYQVYLWVNLEVNGRILIDSSGIEVYWITWSSFYSMVCNLPANGEGGVAEKEKIIVFRWNDDRIALTLRNNGEFSIQIGEHHFNVRGDTFIGALLEIDYA